MNQVRCPSCNSTSVQKSTAIRDQGISRTDSTRSGMGFSSSGRARSYSGRSSSTRVTRLAEINAPPTNDAVAGAAAIGCALPAGILVFGFGVDFGASAIVGTICAIGLGVWAYNVTKDEHEANLAAYQRQWYCKKCGSFFEV